MRAVVYLGHGRVGLRDMPAPAIQAPTDALVRVRMAGICGTDLHAVAGHFQGMEIGSVVGHEFVGEIIETGGAVTRFRRGDQVMASDFTSCGHCHHCTAGDNWQCSERSFFGTGTAFGPALAGAQAEIVRVPHADSTLYAIPKGVSDEAAILVGDNLATGWAAIERGRMQPGDIVVVIGGGAVGQLTSLAAQAGGAGAVLLIEPNEQRRAFARTHGAIAASPDAASGLLHQLSGGRGAELVVEAVGIPKVLSQAFDLVGRRGSVISVGAHSERQWPIPLADCFTREISIGFAIGDSIRLRPRLLKMIATGILDPTVVVDRHVGFDEVVSAYDELRAQTSMKTVINL